jgi:hypothetical protein
MAGDGLFAAPDCGCQPRLSATTEALFLHLRRGDSRDLVFDDVSGDPVLGTEDLNLGMTAGPRLSLRYTFRSAGTLELSYFGFHHWDDAVTAQGTDRLSLPAPLAPFTEDYTGATAMTTSLSADIHNAEVNVIRPLADSDLSILAGFRYLNLDERFGLRSVDLQDGTSDMSVSTDNNLFGCQLGALLQRQFNQFGLEVLGKAGIFGNDAQQSAFMADVNNTSILRDSHDRGGRVAFVGEFGVAGTYQFNPALTCRVGYNIFWLQGVARATDQLDFGDTAESGTQLRSDGEAFLHGVSVGLEGRW